MMLNEFNDAIDVDIGILKKIYTSYKENYIMLYIHTDNIHI